MQTIFNPSRVVSQANQNRSKSSIDSKTFDLEPTSTFLLFHGLSSVYTKLVTW